MKKHYFLLTLFLSAFLGLTAQDVENTSTPSVKNPTLRSHEIKINAPALLFPALDVSYEYILTDGSAVGASAAYHFMPTINMGFHLSPYYRLYFGRKRANGFFIEGNVAVLSVKDHVYDGDMVFGNLISSDMRTTMGLGINVGVKILTRKGVVLEFFGGAGRSLFFNEYYPRFGVNIGKRL